MTGSYAYTPRIWPSLLTVLLLVALAAFGWRRRTLPGARVFAVACLIAVPWVAGAALVKFQAVWQLPVATALTCLASEYAWPGRRLTRPTLVLMSIPSPRCLGFVLTGNVHHLIQIRRSSRSIGANLGEAWAKRQCKAHFVSKLTDANGEQYETQRPHLWLSERHTRTRSFCGRLWWRDPKGGCND